MTIISDSQKVVLIGPMGVGKSTIGKLLASELGWPYFDNDVELVAISGMSAEKLSLLTVAELHKLESLCLETVIDRPGPFIAGAASSVVDFEGNLRILKEATSIYLRMSPEKLDTRAGSSGIGRSNIEEDIEPILRERFTRRDPMYRAVSKLVIDVGTSSVSDAEKIISFLQDSK